MHTVDGFGGFWFNCGCSGCSGVLGLFGRWLLGFGVCWHLVSFGFSVYLILWFGGAHVLRVRAVVWVGLWLLL